MKIPEDEFSRCYNVFHPKFAAAKEIKSENQEVKIMNFHLSTMFFIQNWPRQKKLKEKMGKLRELIFAFLQCFS